METLLHHQVRLGARDSIQSAAATTLFDLSPHDLHNLARSLGHGTHPDRRT